MFSGPGMKFYERGCQEKYLLNRRPPSPQHSSWQPAPSPSGSFVDSGCCEQFDRSSQLWTSSETEKRHGHELPTTVLSEPRGLLLFQVVRGGIESDMDLRPSRGHPPPGSSPSTLAFRIVPTTSHCFRRSAGKRLETAMSSSLVSSDRTPLLSSKCSARPPQSYAPASGVPSLHACPSARAAPDTCGKVQFELRR